MLIPEGSPVKEKVVQGDIYKASGIEQTFLFPQPFTAEDMQPLADEYQIHAHGLANQANQILTENCANNLASRIRLIAKERDNAAEDKPIRELPNQATLDKLVADYNFSGVRVSQGKATLPPFDRELLTLVKELMRAQLRKFGYPAGGLAAPVTVVRGAAKLSASQISKETFASIVDEVVSGADAWGEEGTPQYNARQVLMETAQQNVDAAARSAEATGSLLS